VGAKRLKCWEEERGAGGMGAGRGSGGREMLLHNEEREVGGMEAGRGSSEHEVQGFLTEKGGSGRNGRRARERPAWGTWTSQQE